jgi:hypothetical protein
MTTDTTSASADPAVADVASSDAATYDLTSKISPYLDLHMMFPLLEYIDSLISSGAISYNSIDVAQARLELLKPTHMVDYAMDIYREVHGMEADIPQEMEDQKVEVLKKMEELRDAQIKLDELCRNEELRVSACLHVCGVVCCRPCYLDSCIRSTYYIHNSISRPTLVLCIV